MRNLQSTHPSFANVQISELFHQQGGPYDFISNRPASFSTPLTSLQYKVAFEQADGSLYEGLWNDLTNQSEGPGVLVAKDGSLHEGLFKDGVAEGHGRRLTLDTEV